MKARTTARILLWSAALAGAGTAAYQHYQHRNRDVAGEVVQTTRYVARPQQMDRNDPAEYLDHLEIEVFANGERHRYSIRGREAELHALDRLGNGNRVEFRATYQGEVEADGVKFGR